MSKRNALFPLYFSFESERVIMLYKKLAGIGLLTALFLTGACSGEAYPVTAAPTATEAPATNTPTPTYSPAPTPTSTLTPTPTATNTPTPTLTPSPTPVPDTEAPVITGVKPIEVVAGETVSYKKGIEVTDNSGEDIKLEIDNTNVDLEKPGKYTVIYSAADSAGNTVSIETTVTVFTADKHAIEEEASRLADELVSKIITDDMDDWTVIETLWEWCRNNIKYTYADGDMTSEYTGAYEGLHNRVGDCWSYYATLKVLLDKVGIQNLKCSRVGGTSEHYWNLVLYNGEWYHCDCSPLAKGETFRAFLQTDDQLRTYMRYNKERPDYYKCDFSMEPARSTNPVYDGWTHTKLVFDKTITESEYIAKLEVLRETLPDGKYWNDGKNGVTDSPCTHKNGKYDKCNYHHSPVSLLFPFYKWGWQCAGFANLLSDEVFGADTAAYFVYGYDNMRPGDLLRVNYSDGSGHSAFILEKTDEYITVAECNADYKTCLISWGRKITREELEKDNAVYIRRSCEIIQGE